MRRLSALFVGLIACFALPVLAFAAPVSVTQTTASYKVVLDIGPVETMLTPDQAKGATSGEVMVQMMGVPMPSMSMTDQGQPVNHHLEVHLYNKATGAVITDQMPMISITNQKTNANRQLSSVMGMYGVTQGMSDFHVGNNVYLADGTYTITVQIGTEKAVFANVAVSGAAPAAAPMPMPMPASLPQTGGLPPGVLAGVGGIGVGLVGFGRLVRRRAERR
jgi:hypothetical protein